MHIQSKTCTVFINLDRFIYKIILYTFTINVQYDYTICEFLRNSVGIVTTLFTMLAPQIQDDGLKLTYYHSDMITVN